MKNKTIYMLSVDYGGMENFCEMAFVDEGLRNELALAFAEELEHANFNRNVEGWLGAFPPTRKGIESAIAYAVREAQDWFYAQHVVTWEVPLYE